ncbi:MAG: hypothetical protein Q8885_02665 [Candidatus Phytoplasma stylosanthis]|nr:hypothetical protein [Candidatus Phytoplasma stylosanthis]
MDRKNLKKYYSHFQRPVERMQEDGYSLAKIKALFSVPELINYGYSTTDIINMNIVLNKQKRRKKMSKRKLKQLEIKKIMKEGLNKNE